MQVYPHRVGAGVEGTMGGDASPFDLPERAALDARASLARRVGASVALGGETLSLQFLAGTQQHAATVSRPSKV